MKYLKQRSRKTAKYNVTNDFLFYSSVGDWTVQVLMHDDTPNEQSALLYLSIIGSSSSEENIILSKESDPLKIGESSIQVCFYSSVGPYFALFPLNFLFVLFIYFFMYIYNFF